MCDGWRVGKWIYFEMADGIDELGVDVGSGACVCRLRVDDVCAHGG